MKKIINLFIFALTLASCDKETNSTLNDEIVKPIINRDVPSIFIPEDFDFFGEAHNTCLDTVFSRTFLLNPNTTYQEVMQTCNEYCFQEHPIISQTIGDISNEFGEVNDNIIMVAINANSIIDLQNLYESKISFDQVQALQDLDKIINNNLEFESLIENIESFEQNIRFTLIDEDIPFIFLATSLAKKSFTYWHSPRGQQWYDILKNNSSLPNFPEAVDWHNVAVADIAGFLAGFCGGAVTGAQIGAVALGIETGGLGALPGAIIGAGIGGSATGLVSATKASACTLAAEMILDSF